MPPTDTPQQRADAIRDRRLSRITVAPGHLTASLELVHGSALEGCTGLDADDEGTYFLRRWPSLSSGEELLWQVLAWLNGAPERPSDLELATGLDTLSAAAAMRAVGVGGGA